MVTKPQIAPDVSPMDTPITYLSHGKSELQPLVKVLCDLIDFLSQNENQTTAPLKEIEYQQLAERLDTLLDIVDAKENHPLAPLMHFVGTLIKEYESDHIQKLEELF